MGEAATTSWGVKYASTELGSVASYMVMLRSSMPTGTGLAVLFVVGSRRARVRFSMAMGLTSRGGSGRTRPTDLDC